MCCYNGFYSKEPTYFKERKRASQKIFLPGVEESHKVSEKIRLIAQADASSEGQSSDVTNTEYDKKTNLNMPTSSLEHTVGFLEKE